MFGEFVGFLLVLAGGAALYVARRRTTARTIVRPGVLEYDPLAPAYGPAAAPIGSTPSNPLLQFVSAEGGSQPVSGRTVNAQIDAILGKVATQVGVDPDALRALAWMESTWNPNALNPGGPSYGLMQILCGGTGERCANKLYLDGWPPTRASLADPETNAYWGAQIYKANLRQFGSDPIRAAVAYNNYGAAVKGPPYSELPPAGDLAPAEYARRFQTFYRTKPWAR